MNTPNFVILYVDSPERSGAFYGALLERQPVETSPTFVLFVLDNGFKLGLWSRHTVEPSAAAAGGGAELVFALNRARCGGRRPQGLGRTRPDHPANADRHGFRPHLRCARSRQSPAARLLAER